MEKVVAEYNASQSDVRVVMDTSGPDIISGSFVRGNPPDLILGNYNQEIARFIQRCALSDLSDMPEVKRVRENTWPLMHIFGQCINPDGTPRVSALPYSVMAAGVIYNKDIFAKYGLEVPTTWDQLIAICDKLKENGVDPFYATFASGDAWTIAQGWFEYSALSSGVNTNDFFEALNAEGTNVGPDSQVSFQKDYAFAAKQMRHLADNYTNADALSRGYGDGNTAMAEGKGAMLMQGPWAFSEIKKQNPDINLGSFPLPVTNDPKDLTIRVNSDLAVMIPVDSRHKDEARAFLQYLYEPERILDYNKSQMGFTPTVEAPNPDAPEIEGMIKYFNDGRFGEGPFNVLPNVIPTNNYAHEMIIGPDPVAPLVTIDADWVRLAQRR